MVGVENNRAVLLFEFETFKVSYPKYQTAVIGDVYGRCIE